MSTDEVARLEEEGRRLDVEIDALKGQDVRASQWGIALKEYEKRMREAGISEIVIHVDKSIEGLKAVFGLKPGEYELKFGPIGGRPVEFPRFNPEGEILPETKTKPEPTFFHSFPVEPPPAEEIPTIPPISREVGVPVPGPPPFTEEIVPQQTVNNINYHFSHDLHYHPRVGSDESGPRIAPGVNV